MDSSDGGSVTLEGFRAELEVFSGPLELLLHLVKQEEVDIFEVPICRVTERYLAALRSMEFFDVNVASDFLVVAATLTEMKSRTLLPPSQGEQEEEGEDPGAELVRRLLEYKEYKEAAGDLSERAQARAARFARSAQKPQRQDGEESSPEALLEDLAIWDLMAAFAEVVEQTQLRPTGQIVRSNVPVSAYVEEVLAALRSRGGSAGFVEFFRYEQSRARMVGIFLALLELVRRKTIHVEQREADGWHIEVSLRGTG
ncbi:MAG: segregation and condensation protein A [Planctomycetota bacterium]|jgi:segregation and condensation protein A